MLVDKSKDIVDVNEAFDKILLAEDLAEEKAYEEGFGSGKAQTLEGYHFGYHRASSLAAQLGYYLGLLTYIQQFATLTKISGQTRDLIKQIQKFPLHNDDDAFDTVAQFESIKLNVKKICSTAKVDPKYPESNQTDF